MKRFRLWYMRDDHLFAPLTSDLVEENLQTIAKHFDAGWSYGMLCGHHPSPSERSVELVHAHGRAKRTEFMGAAREWLGKYTGTTLTDGMEAAIAAEEITQ